MVFQDFLGSLGTFEEGGGVGGGGLCYDFPYELRFSKTEIFKKTN